MSCKDAYSPVGRDEPKASHLLMDCCKIQEGKNTKSKRGNWETINHKHRGNHFKVNKRSDEGQRKTIIIYIICVWRRWLFTTAHS